MESRFEGSVIEYIGYSILASLVTIFTFGLAFPWVEVMFQSWVCRNTIINYIKWLLLTFITFGIYGFWLFNKMTHWRIKHTHFAD